MKGINLDETWRLCLQMWKWIVKEWKKRIREDYTDLDSNFLVEELKEEWLAKHKFGYIRNTCFFCKYAGINCSECPARKIDKRFDCMKCEYNFGYKPVEFLKKITRLNKIRLAKRKTKKG